jgi:septum formation protein
MTQLEGTFHPEMAASGRYLRQRNMAPTRLILASQSPQRKKLLAEAGYPFEVMAPDAAVDCGICSSGGPASLVAVLASRKAADVARQVAADTPALLLACDTLAECQGAILGKPQDQQQARTMLEQLSGKTHRVYSGLCLWPHRVPHAPSQPETKVAVTELRMKELSAAELDEYLASDLWCGKAGAFGYQDRLGWLEVLAGSESNVIGLPLELLTEMLQPWKACLNRN